MALKSTFLYFKFKNNIDSMSKFQLNKDLLVLKDIKTQLNIKKDIVIYRSNEIIIPFVIGFLNYNIYLPNTYITDVDMENILLHEVNHIVGRDNLKKILILAVKTMLWWNPLVYVLSEDVNHILEIQCDLRTTSKMTKEDRIKYLESIINMIKSTKNKKTNIPVINNSLQTSSLYNSNDEKLKQRFTLVVHYFKKERTLEASTILLFIITISLFISSYIVIIKPDYSPVEEGIYLKHNEPSFRIKTEESFILKVKD